LLAGVADVPKPSLSASVQVAVAPGAPGAVCALAAGAASSSHPANATAHQPTRILDDEN
jgi:hypothetical protein